jgi:hypothetical protein
MFSLQFEEGFGNLNKKNKLNNTNNPFNKFKQNNVINENNLHPLNDLNAYQLEPGSYNEETTAFPLMEM